LTHFRQQQGRYDDDGNQRTTDIGRSRFSGAVHGDTTKLVSDWKEPKIPHTYVVGNSRDFDQFARFFVEALGNSFAGAATFWPEALEVVDENEQRIFTPGNRHIGRPTVDRPDLLFCQSIITSDREVRGIISTVVDLIDVGSIKVCALHVTDIAKANLQRYFDESSELPVRVSAPDVIRRRSDDGWGLQSMYYDALESALGPDAKASPAFVRDRLRNLRKPAQGKTFTM